MIWRALSILLIAQACHAQGLWAHHRAAASQPAAATGEAAPTAQANLIGWWRFSATDTGASVADASGNGNTMTQGTPSAQPTVASGHGSFDGGDSLATASTSLLNGSANGATWCVWARYNGPIPAAIRTPIGTRGSGNNVYGEILSFPTASKWAGMVNNNASDSTVAVSTGVWMCVGMTVRLSSGALYRQNYVNGSPAGSETVVGIPAIKVDAAWKLGVSGTFFYWLGDLDDGRLYNKALSAAEMAAVYAEGRR